MPPAEILVCDDGSVDATLEIVDRIAAGASVPIRVINNVPRLGFSDNFLNGAEMATSQFVAFCDQDDVWHPEKLARAVELLISEQAVLSAHAVKLIDAHGAPLGIDIQGIDWTHVAEPLTEWPWRNYFGFSIVVDRTLLGALPRSERGSDTHSPDTPLSHDRWACFLGLSLGRAVLIHEPLASYRQHPGQLYGSDQGGPRHVSVATRARSSWTHYRSAGAVAAERSRARAAQCAHRSDLLARADWPDRPAVDRAVAYWRALADQYVRRSAIYSGPLHRRVWSIVTNYASGAYAPTRSGGLGRAALAQDLSSLLARHIPYRSS